MKIVCFPARYGESFLINICNETKMYNILIDCGLNTTYTGFIKNQLLSLKKIDLLVLTHIDDDHIGGAISLFSDTEIINNIEIDNIWFNDLYKITEGLYKQNIEISSKATQSGQGGKFDQEVSYKSAKCLANYILESKHKDNWNKGESIISCDINYYKELYPFGDEVKVVLLSPNENKINGLLNKWCKKLNIDKDKIVIDDKALRSFYGLYLNDNKICGRFDENCSARGSSIEELAEQDYYTNNINNDASIAFFIEAEKKRVLFLGDSNPKDIEENLRQYMTDKKIDIIDFHIVKLSHHGSKNNISNELLKLWKCNKYIISTNGERYNHPDLQCLAKLIVKQTDYKKIFFNYKNNRVLRTFNKAEYKKTYKYDLVMPNENDPIITNIMI